MIRKRPNCQRLANGENFSFIFFIICFNQLIDYPINADQRLVNASALTSSGLVT